MEEGSGRRTRPLIPANYVTLRQLQEEKINRKMREEEERKRRKEEEQEAREHKIIKEEEEVELKKTEIKKKKKKKKKEEEINRKIENEAVMSEWIGKGVTEDVGEERKPKSKEKNNKRKGANKREKGEEGEQTKGEEKMKEAARGDRFSRLKSSRKIRKPDTSGEPVLCLTVDEDDDREATSSSSSSNLRDRQLRNMQRVGEVTKAIGVLNLGEKGGGAFVDGGMAGERKRLVSGGRGGGRGLGRRGGGRDHSMVWVKKSAV